MDNAIKLIEAIAKLIGSFSWPLAVILIGLYLLRRHRNAVDRALDRMDSLTFPGGLEMTMGEKIDDQDQQVIEAAGKVVEAAPEEQGAALAELREETIRGEMLRRLAKVITESEHPSSDRQAALSAFTFIDGITPHWKDSDGEWLPLTDIQDLIDHQRTHDAWALRRGSRD